MRSYPDKMNPDLEAGGFVVDSGFDGSLKPL